MHWDWSQEHLDRWLEQNNADGLVEDAAVPVSDHTRVLILLEDLVDGCTYHVEPVDEPLRTQIKDLKNHQRSSGMRRDEEMEKAMMSLASNGLYTEQPNSLYPKPELRVLMDLGGKTIAEWDAVVEVKLPDGTTEYMVGEHKTVTHGTADVTKFLGKVKASEEVISKLATTGKPHPFHGKKLKLAFMAEHVNPKVERTVADLCHTLNITRLKRGTGGIIRASASARCVRLCG